MPGFNFIFVQSIVQMATIYDIAKKLNITPSTVSRALSDHPRISQKTKIRVREMASQMNYEPNKVAAALRSGKTYILGVILPTTDRSFFSSVIRGIEEVANRAGYNVMITQSNDSTALEVSDINALLKAQVDGIIASIAKQTITFEHFKKIKERGLPLVLFDRVNENLDASIVVIDDYRGAYSATTHLIEQGCERIAHFGGQQHINIYKNRFRGYLDALEDNGIEFNPDRVILSDLQVADGRAGMTQLLKLPKPPDALFAASDYSAVGAMQTLKDKGLKIPKDVALVGFSNEPFTSFVEPALSTVDQRSEEMGQFAAKIFLEEVQANNGDFMPRKSVLTPELIIRGSSLKRNYTSA